MTKKGITLAAVLIILFVLLTTLVVQAEFGTGWTAQYFNNPDLQGTPVFSEALPTGINVNWGTGSPNPAVPVDNWSARFQSVQIFNQGTYEFVVSSDDGVRVFIDGAPVWDRFVGRVLTTDRFQLNMTPGSHQIVVEYVEFVDQAAIQFQYFQIATQPGLTPGFGQTPGFFGTPGFGFTPTPVYTGPTATVSGARGLALRTGPYLGASFVTTILPGQGYPVIARNRDEGIYNWYLLRVGERTGWASGRFLTISVPLDQLPLQGSIFDQIDAAADIGARAYPRAQMNIRTRPSTRVPVVGSIPWGGTAELIGRTVQAGEDQWYHIRYGGMVGWIDADWVTARGEMYQVPIR